MQRHNEALARELIEMKEKLRVSEGKSIDLKAVVQVVRDAIRSGELSFDAASDVAQLKQAMRFVILNTLTEVVKFATSLSCTTNSFSNFKRSKSSLICSLRVPIQSKGFR